MELKVEEMNESEKAEIKAKIKDGKDFDCLVKTESADVFVEFVEAEGHTAKRAEKHAEGYTNCSVFITP